MSVGRSEKPEVCPTCHNEGTVERLATPEEVDNGCELGIAFDPCPNDAWHHRPKGTTCECGADLHDNGCENPWCDHWRLASEFDAAFPGPEAS